MMIERIHPKSAGQKNYNTFLEKIIVGPFEWTLDIH